MVSFAMSGPLAVAQAILGLAGEHVACRRRLDQTRAFQFVNRRGNAPAAPSLHKSILQLTGAQRLILAEQLQDQLAALDAIMTRPAPLAGVAVRCRTVGLLYLFVADFVHVIVNVDDARRRVQQAHYRADRHLLDIEVYFMKPWH